MTLYHLKSCIPILCHSCFLSLLTGQSKVLIKSCSICYLHEVVIFSPRVVHLFGCPVSLPVSIFSKTLVASIKVCGKVGNKEMIKLWWHFDLFVQLVPVFLFVQSCKMMKEKILNGTHFHLTTYSDSRALALACERFQDWCPDSPFISIYLIY